MAYIVIPSGASSHHAKGVPLLPLVPVGNVASWTDIKALFPNNTSFPDTADVVWTIGANSAKLDWVTNIGTGGTASLTRVDGSRPPGLTPENVNTWDEFRHYVRNLPPYRYVF